MIDISTAEGRQELRGRYDRTMRGAPTNYPAIGMNDPDPDAIFDLAEHVAPLLDHIEKLEAERRDVADLLDDLSAAQAGHDRAMRLLDAEIKRREAMEALIAEMGGTIPVRAAERA